MSNIKLLLIICIVMIVIIMTRHSSPVSNRYYSYSPVINNEMTNKDDCIVTKVVDWDTINVNCDGILSKVRILSMDAPESNTLRRGQIECYWIEAKLFTRNMLLNTHVSLVRDPTQYNADVYWRLLRHVYVGWELFSSRAIRLGYAWFMQPRIKSSTDKILKHQEVIARNANVGLWNACGWKRIRQ